MAKTDFRTFDDYLATFPPEVQADLIRIFDAIRAAVPEAEEAISYQIPAFRHHGWIFYVAAYAKHYSLSAPPPTALYEEFAGPLAGYKTSKAAIQIPKDKPLPLDLIRDMAAFRAKENLARPKKS
jgi:uncharacterized protein YdhG (YjbR/CyaY superfamily)